MVGVDDEKLIFEEEKEEKKEQEKKQSWKILIVDDEEEVHTITKLALKNKEFNNKKIEFLSAYSGKEAIEILKNNDDICLILLDVVMEEEDSGLKLVKYIREELKNNIIRIVLRTGQPGQAPEEKVIVQYDINDYKSKTELTSQKLFTTVITSIRSYIGLKTIDEYNKTLEEKVKERTQQLMIAFEELKRKNEILTRELALAKRVQDTIVPSDTLIMENSKLKFCAKYNPVDSIGGDLYDMYRINDDYYGFLVADVSGHGVPAALIATMAKVLFSNTVNLSLNPEEICEKVNKEMYKLIGEIGYYFLALNYGIINYKTGEFNYIIAGHYPIILFHSREQRLEKLVSKNLPLGIFETTKFRSSFINLSSGDKLLFITDGIIEARNENGEQYGEYRLMNFMLNHYNLDPKQFVENLLLDLNKFCKNYPQSDDRTILYIEYSE